MAIIFLMEQIRTPFSLIWTIMSPTVLFFSFISMKLNFIMVIQHGSENKYHGLQATFLFLLFCLITVCIWSEEECFIATFVHNMDGRLLFIRSQLIASLIMSILYVFFILVVLTGFQASPDYQIVMIILKSIYINAFMMVSLTFMASFRVTFQTASTIYSVLITVCMVSGIVSLKYNEGIVYWINQVNPIAIYSTILSQTRSCL